MAFKHAGGDDVSLFLGAQVQTGFLGNCLDRDPAMAQQKRSVIETGDNGGFDPDRTGEALDHGFNPSIEIAQDMG